MRRRVEVHKRLAMLFDLYARRGAHPVYWIGGALIVASLPLQEIAHDTAAWLNASSLRVRLVS